MKRALLLAFSLTACSSALAAPNTDPAADHTCRPTGSPECQNWADPINLAPAVADAEATRGMRVQEVAKVAVDDPPIPPMPKTTGCVPSACRMVGTVPAYLNFPACSEDDAAIIRAAIANVGGDWDDQSFMIFVASRESHCNNSLINDDPKHGDYSCGWFQLNQRKGPLAPGALLTKAGYTCTSVTESKQESAEAAALLLQKCGHKPWLRPYGCAAGSKGWLI